jgi:phosphoribosylformylglycinamidine synthase subunit PurL
VWLRERHGMVAGRPRIDLAAEANLHRFLAEATTAGLINSAHDISAGGLAAALAESCIAGDIGAHIESMDSADIVAMYGETQSCAVVTCVALATSEVRRIASAAGVDVREIGRVGGAELHIDGCTVAVTALREAYESGLPRALEGVAANV